jgi:succinate dehydrogenase/fumarate reductase flavoprotein subunit
VRTVTEASNDVYRWTVDYLGVKYLDRVDQFGGHSVPRGYTTHNRSGSAIIKQLLLKLKELEVPVRTKVFLQEILKDSNGWVGGAQVREGYTYPDENSGVPKTIRARRAVILATGGFANDIVFRTSHR